MSKKLKKLKGRKISKGPPHELSQEERSRGGKRGSQTVWESEREAKKRRKAENATSEDDFRKLGQQFAAGEPPPPMFATPQRLLKQQEEARKYPPGVWTEDKRIWKARLAEMEGSEVPEADGEEDASA